MHDQVPAMKKHVLNAPIFYQSDTRQGNGECYNTLVLYALCVGQKYYTVPEDSGKSDI